MTRPSRASIRQLRFPRALRIASTDPPSDLEDLIGAVRAAGEKCEPGRDEKVLDDRALAGVATGLWRTRRRMLGDQGDTPRPEVRKEFRHVQSTWDTLAEAGVTIQDHDGELFRTGQALEVLTFQHLPGADDEKVVETIRPSVYLNGRTIQIGQVIVATPENEGPAGADKEGSGA